MSGSARLHHCLNKIEVIVRFLISTFFINLECPNLNISKDQRKKHPPYYKLVILVMWILNNASRQQKSLTANARHYFLILFQEILLYPMAGIYSTYSVFHLLAIRNIHMVKQILN